MDFFKPKGIKERIKKQEEERREQLKKHKERCLYFDECLNHMKIAFSQQRWETYKEKIFLKIFSRLKFQASTFMCLDDSFRYYFEDKNRITIISFYFNIGSFNNKRDIYVIYYNKTSSLKDFFVKVSYDYSLDRKEFFDKMIKKHFGSEWVQ